MPYWPPSTTPTAEGLTTPDLVDATAQLNSLTSRTADLSVEVATLRRSPRDVQPRAPHRVSKETSRFLKFATSEAVERGSTSFHKMNSTAIDRECSKETDRCIHKLAWHGWLRDALPATVMFRPYSAGPVNRKPAAESDAPKATARTTQAINISGRLSLLRQNFLGLRSPSSHTGAPISSQYSNESKGLCPTIRTKQKN